MCIDAAEYAPSGGGHAWWAPAGSKAKAKLGACAAPAEWT